MNIKQENVTAAGTRNNNISAGGGKCTCSTMKVAAGCSACGVHTLDSSEESMVEWHMQGGNGANGHTEDSASTIHVANKGQHGSVQSRDLQQYDRRVYSIPVDVCESGLDTQQGLDLEITACPDCGQGHEGKISTGHITANNTKETAGVCCESGADSLVGVESLTTMRNCGCDEAALCFCPSSAFKASTDQDVRWQLSKKSLVMGSASSCSKRQGTDMDAVFAADEGIGSDQERVDDTCTCSNDETVPVEEDVKQCKRFMEDLVDRIFNNSVSICQEDNAKFGEYCQLAIGRLWFARLVDSQRVNCKKVTEQTFYRLVQFFAVCLFECSDADDFTPGKSLMNMCFTFYHEHEGFPRCDDMTRKSFLFSHLTEQPIWKSLRFWNSAFFDAVHQERKQRSPDNQVSWRHLSSEERENTEILNENITFGQLATFLHNMMELELSQAMCQQFLDKMATIGNLCSDQKDLIQSNIKHHFQVEMEENTKNKRHQKSSNKLNFMKRKVGRESMS